MSEYALGNYEEYRRLSKGLSWHSVCKPYLVYYENQYYVVCTKGYLGNDELERYELVRTILGIELAIYDREYKDKYNIIGKHVNKTSVILFLGRPGGGYEKTIIFNIIGSLYEDPKMTKLCATSKGSLIKVNIEIPKQMSSS